MVLPVLKATRRPKFRLLVSACLIWMITLPASGAVAAQIYLNIPGISGEDSIPGHSSVMAVTSLTVDPSQFAVVKRVDSASPTIHLAVVQASSFSNASLYLFNSNPTGPPDATLSFQNLIASSYQLLGGNTPLERDGFHFSPTVTMYLELPGITGESSTPGHPGVIAIRSFSLSGDSFSVDKLIDKTSPQLFLDAAQGTSFSTASVLFYDSTPQGQPDMTLEFRNVIDSGYSQSGINQPLETDTFNFASVTFPGTATPAPGSLTMLALGLMSVVGLGWLTAFRRRGTGCQRPFICNMSPWAHAAISFDESSD
jgi:type VI protein secretion system component Hcp